MISNHTIRIGLTAFEKGATDERGITPLIPSHYVSLLTDQRPGLTAFEKGATDERGILNMRDSRINAALGWQV